ncbi:pseudouridine synthase [Phakopsora pachyrhizi]|uniref:Pseudouridine synthase n=1 Tax=Phakopsora pachyrhizi TaxID=170000 RepID=A0AAV0BKT3_PHAPC|nr:pseudouridine synthase [Phakopsora pachyrhizi]
MSTSPGSEGNIDKSVALPINPRKRDLSPLTDNNRIKNHRESHKLLKSIDMSRTCLSEEQVGITQYINPCLPTFSAILKHRFTDFLVYEVDNQGQVVHLKDINDPRASEKSQDEIVKCKPVSLVEWPVDSEVKLLEILCTSELEILKQFVSRGPPSNAKRRESKKPTTETKKSESDEKLYEQSNDGNPDNESAVSSVISKPIESKDQRKKFHQTIRELFQGRLVTEHKEIEGNQPAIEITWTRPGKNTDRKPKPVDSKPPFIHFTLQKTNRETQDALSILSRQLHCNVSKDLGICGTKDKRSVSCQRVSLRRGKRTIEDVWCFINRVKKNQKPVGGVVFKERGEKGIRVGDFCYQEEPLKLGQLQGNRFVIVLRDIFPTEPKLLKEAVDTLATRGFLNYFGMQRFGTTSVGTHLLGLSLLRGEWDLAIDLIMRHKVGDPQDVELARSVWLEKKDARSALDLMPRRCVAERSILQFFSKQKTCNDKCGALASIPKNLKMMYIHAYQSYIWNTILSERVELYGCDKPVIGDLVEVKDGKISETIDADLESEEIDEPERLASVKLLKTAEDCEAYTIYDVVLPLIGYKVTYPGNQLGDRYLEMLRQDGLDPQKLYRTQAYAGTYRKIIHLPGDVNFKLYEYEDPDLSLSQADEDVLLGLELPPQNEWSGESGGGKNLALKVELTLSSSTYATMALREILKSDTGKKAQSKMTQQMRERMAQLPVEGNKIN